jgi:beta-xylosidase
VCPFVLAAACFADDRSAGPPTSAGEVAPRHLLPDRPFPELPRATIAVDLGADEGPLETWRHTVGLGGISPDPLPDRVVAGAAKLRPRLVRVFIQEFFAIYPEHGRFDWGRLDRYMDSLAATGAKVVAAVAIKPRPLFPAVDQRVWRPNDEAEWRRVIAALVKRYSVDRPLVTHWEVGNETDIGENGGCPYLIPDPADYAEYYKLTIRPILDTFPDAKVGGCAVANADGDYLPRFIAACRQAQTRLDFVSWHLYSDDPAHHARLVEKHGALLENFGNRRPEMMVTEWSKGFEPTSVEEMAFDPRRAATIGAGLVAMIDAKVDWTFYYHLWDQVCAPDDFRPFFARPEIMYHHWNEVPHRLGLFGVDGEVRPSYFVYRMLGRLGDRRVRARADADDLRVLAAQRGDDTSLLIVNYGRPRSVDRVATIRLSGLAPGRKTLVTYRVDRAGAGSAVDLELVPRERRAVEVTREFSCQVYCPADSVALVLLGAGRSKAARQ